MGKRWTWVAWSMLAIFIVSVAFATILGVADGSLQQDPAGFVVYVLGFGAFMVVGALVVAHRPGDLSAGSSRPSRCWPSPGAVAEYVTYALVTGQPAAGRDLCRLVCLLDVVSNLALAVVFTPLLFPTGRLLSRWLGPWPGWPGRRRRRSPCWLP